MHSQCLADVYWISGWYILVLKQLTELTVEVNCRLSPYNKENNNLEVDTIIKYIRNGARNMAILLEVWCFIYFNYFISINRMKQYSCDLVSVLLPLTSA